MAYRVSPFTRPLFPRWLVALAAAAAIGCLLYALRGVLTPIFFAMLIAYILDPLVDRLERWRIPRALGIVILLVASLAVVTLFLLLVVPGIVRDIVSFARDLPGKVRGLVDQMRPWLTSMGVEVPSSVHEVLEQVQGSSKDLARSAIAPITAAVGLLIGGTASVIGALVGLLVVPVLAFYLLHDFDRMVAGIRELIPWRVRPFVVDVAKEIDTVLGQFVRGQLIVMAILAVLYSVGYSIVGVRLAVPIGIAAGLLSFIPYVGGAVALGLALLMSLIDFQSGGFAQIAWVLVVYGIVQTLEGFVITPRIVGEKVGLPAVWVLVALLVGGELFGFMGVLLAVPAAAAVKIILLRAVDYYRKSNLYLSGGPEPPSVLRAEGLPDDPETKEAKEHPQPDHAPTPPVPPPPEPDTNDPRDPARAPVPVPDPDPAPDPDPDPDPVPVPDPEEEEIP